MVPKCNCVNQYGGDRCQIGKKLTIEKWNLRKTCTLVILRCIKRKTKTNCLPKMFQCQDDCTMLSNFPFITEDQMRSKISAADVSDLILFLFPDQNPCRNPVCKNDGTCSNVANNDGTGTYSFQCTCTPFTWQGPTCTEGRFTMNQWPHEKRLMSSKKLIKKQQWILVVCKA